MSRIVPFLNGAAWSTGALVQARSRAGASWDRTNFRGSTVSLAGGVASAVGATAALASCGGPTAVAGVIAAGTAGGLGALDDFTEKAADRSTKGLRGHLTALRSGRVTTGAAKLGGITAAGLVAGGILAASAGGHGTRTRGVLDAVARGALVAGTANLLNLLDLRPGRALKAATLIAVPLALGSGPSGSAASGVLGVAAASLPSDLAETTMLGDTGANAIGAGLGVSLAAHRSPVVRLVALGVVVAATVASERVSFSAVIRRTPALSWLDGVGRLDADV